VVSSAGVVIFALLMLWLLERELAVRVGRGAVQVHRAMTQSGGGLVSAPGIH
jgi:hypothetical protein